MARYFSDTTEIFRAVMIDKRTGSRSYRGPYDSPGKAASAVKQEITRGYYADNYTWEVERSTTTWEKVSGA